MGNKAERLAALELGEPYSHYVRRALIAGSEYGRGVLARLNREEIILCWLDPWLNSRPGPVWRLERDALLSALRQEASLLRRQRATKRSAANFGELCDFEFLTHSIVRGSLVIATKGLIEEAREAQAAHRRAMDLERWQAGAEQAAAVEA